MNAKPPRQAKAFSLIELLVVMGALSLLVAMMLPAISGFSGSAARRGAVTTVMSTFEQARVVALESGRTTYVVFWRRVFPEPDALMVLRETEAGTGTYEPMSHWIKLPKNILLHQPAVGQSMLSIDPSSAFIIGRMPMPINLAAGESLNVLAFNDSGGVAFPPDKPNRKLIISEGVRGENGTATLLGSQRQSQSAAGGGFEIISVSRHTGRSQLDITTLQ